MLLAQDLPEIQSKPLHEFANLRGMCAAVLETRDVVAARQPGSLRIFWLSELVTAFLFRNVRSALQLLHLVGVR